MTSCYGKNIRVSIFGQSHSASIGVVVDGLPSGHKVDMEKLNGFMARRAPGHNEYSTARKESDCIEILSGLKNKVLCGAPFAAVIKNTDTRSADYTEFVDKPRPGHADFTAQMKFGGAQDISGGGHFSGRMTAPLCIAGGIILQILSEDNILIGAHAAEIAGIEDKPFNPVNITKEDILSIQERSFPVNDYYAGEKMKNAIAAAREAGDSVGGIVECAVTGLPAGVGDPLFDGMENRISSAVFAVPAVKGIEFGSGFAGSRLTGKENNDAFTYCSGIIKTSSNRHGGILGGITSGMPVIFRAAIKPTPSISMEQRTVSFSAKRDEMLSITGRHDPCIVPRAVPCIESAAALAIYDALLDFKIYR
jgi:chorismate synthase